MIVQTFTAPKTPTLFTELSMGTDALSTEVYGPQTHAYVLNKGDIVDLMVVNYDGEQKQSKPNPGCQR